MTAPIPHDWQGSLDVLLVRPAGERMYQAEARPAAVEYYQCHESLGIGYIASALRRAGATVAIIDATIDDVSEIQLQEFILQHQPAMLGFTILWEGYEDVQDMCAALRRNGYQGHITLGQHFATFNYEEVLRDTPQVNSVVRFEGEVTAVELLRAIQSDTPLLDVQGLAWRRDDGTIVANENRPLVEDLSELRFPARDVLARNLDKVHRVMISGSRGCPWRCKYCSITTFYRIPEGKLWRCRSAESLVDEMEEIVRLYGKRCFGFTDDQFMGAGRRGRDFAKAFAEEIIRRDLSVEFAFETRADSVQPELFSLLKQAGLYIVFLGIESGYQPTLDYFQKDITVAENRRAIDVCEALDIDVSLGCIMFHERTTIEEIRANLDFYGARLGPQMFFGDISIYNGTEFMEEAVAQPSNLVQIFDPTDDATSLRSNEAYSKEWVVVDPTAREFKREIQTLLRPMAIPYCSLDREKYARILPMQMLLACERRLGQATVEIASTLLDAIESDTLDSETRKTLMASVNRVAEHVENTISLLSILAQPERSMRAFG